MVVRWPDPTGRLGLLPISAAYGAIVQRRFRTALPYRSKLPVICIGNFTVGGAGKTPVALKLAPLLRDAGASRRFFRAAMAAMNLVRMWWMPPWTKPGGWATNRCSWRR